MGLAVLVLFSVLGGRAGPLDALVPFTRPAQAFAALGALLGLALAAEIVGVFRLSRILALVSGTVAGSFAGLVMYSIGYVLATIFQDRASTWDALLLAAPLSFTYVQLFCVALGGLIGFTVVKYAWRFYGVLAYVSLVSVVVGYLGYAILVSLPLVPPEGKPLSYTLLLAETASLFLVVVYAYYSLDVSARRRWRRLPKSVPFSKYYVPKVAFHVTVFNEPPGMVIQSLEALERVDYPPEKRLIMVLDDSTDARTRDPLRAYCEERGHAYVHRTDRRGYKAGALNHALALMPSDVELVSVIDADFQVEPEYLKETVGYFVNPNLGFLQTPQDYRNLHQSFLTEAYYYADAYFYRAILPTRNEVNTIIFCGTMGLIRRSTLDSVEGFREDCLTEDSELSVRMLERGWDSLYVNRTFGRGLIPATYEAYKKQLHRWAFGGAQILRRHARGFLFGRMTLRQKLDFFVGSLHWFDGIFILLIAIVLSALAIGDLRGDPVMTFHQREVWLVGLVPFFLLLDGVTRLHLAMKRSVNVGLATTLKVLGIWYAIKFNNMFAALKAMAGVKMPFVRTPKAPERRPSRLVALARSVRLAPFETSVFLLLLSLAALETRRAAEEYLAHGSVLLTRAILVVWIVYYALLFIAAPLYAYKAYTTFVPDEPPPSPRAAAPVAVGHAGAERSRPG